ncbi:MAG: glycyl-radical enzyme activating protein [Nitrospirae bacterium]|nr:glycyl-radical enzyme activating protein [Nitrospirota bacterium]
MSGILIIPSPSRGGLGWGWGSSNTRINRPKCTKCGECVIVCPGHGLRSIGRYYEVKELTEILMRDISFYRYSGGGVTLSGGECTMYPDYLEELLHQLKSNNIHTLLETSGYFDYSTFKKKILPYIDVIYYDVKIADEDDHKMFIGKSNRMILDNLRLLINEEDVQVIPRVPLIPGITATQKNLSDIVNLLRGIGAENISLLPYNPMGMTMYTCLGRERLPLPDSFMKPDEEEELYEMFRGILRGEQGAEVRG